MVHYSEPGLDSVFEALADPVRRRFVEKLSGGERTVSYLAQPLSMSMPAVLKHLAVLERGGLVKTEKRGRTRYCRLRPDSLAAARAWLDEQERFWRTRLEALDRYLLENP